MRQARRISVFALLCSMALLVPGLASAKPMAAERGPHLSGSIETLSALLKDAPGETPTARLRCTNRDEFSREHPLRLCLHGRGTAQ